MIRILIINLILVILPNVLVANTQYFEEGLDLFKNKKYDAAKFKFEQDIVFNPKSEMSYLYLSKIFNNLDKKDLEEQNLDTVILLNPKNEEATYYLARLKLDLSDYQRSRELNNKLLEIISNYIPDVIVFGHADLIDNETIEFIKKNYPNIKLCQWFLDRMDGEWFKNKDRFIKKIKLMDANFCTTEPKSLKFRKYDNVYYMPNCVDQSLEKLEIYNNKYFKSDVFFAMSHGVHRGVLKKGKIDARENLIKKLINITPNIKFDFYGLNGNQPIWSDDFLKSLSQNKIGLNLSQGKSSNYYSSDRFSQLIGNGLLVMIDKKTKIGEFFERDEIVTYNGISDLSEKIIKYTEDNKERKRIAKKGRIKYFKYFNSKIIADFIINKTYGINKKYYWEKFL